MGARKQRLLVLSAVALSLAASSILAGPPSSTLEQSAELAIAARQKMMQQDATAADVDAFLALCTDNLIYEDPVVKMRIEGKDHIREGMASFLGTSRHARIAVTKRIAAANVVVFQQTVSFEEKQEDDRWKPSSRDQVTIFEFEGSRIARIADYWAR